MTLHRVNNPITEKTFLVALEAIDAMEENHQENVYCIIGDQSKDADAMRKLLKNKELINKELDDFDVEDIKWQIKLLDAMAEMRSWLPPSVK